MQILLLSAWLRRSTMERMKCMKDKLIEVAYEEINHNLKNLNTYELGEIIDMVKD